MAEEQDVIENFQAGPAPRSPLMNIFMVLVLVAAAAAGGYFAQEFLSGPAPKVAPEPGQEVAVPKPAAPAVGVMIPLEPFLVNLAKSKGNRILKVTVTLELNNPATRPEVHSNMQKILDSILVLLSSKTFEDVYSVQGKYKLKDEITTRVNRFLTMGHVKEVYFSEFIIQ